MTDEPPTMADAMMGLSELMAPVPEAVAGYRKQLEAAGFNETAAEMMAVQYHSHIIAMLMKAIP